MGGLIFAVVLTLAVQTGEGPTVTYDKFDDTTTIKVSWLKTVGSGEDLHVYLISGHHGKGPKRLTEDASLIIWISRYGEDFRYGEDHDIQIVCGDAARSADSRSDPPL